MNLRIWAYRHFQRDLVEKWILPHWMSPQRIDDEAERGVAGVASLSKRGATLRAWFHAASVGELESLAPVITAWAGLGRECIVTVLSESAHDSIEKLSKSLAGLSGALIYSGYAPWEGRWAAALAALAPSVFVTAKYEAWPELWFSLQRAQVPLVIVSAKARRSLKLGRIFCRGLGGRLPRIRLLTVSEPDQGPLKQIFGSDEVQIQTVGEPRWDRVFERSQNISRRASDLIEWYQYLKRPWGVLGSVWPQDMDVWRGRFAKGGGTLWVIPHRVDPPSVAAIEAYLVAAGLRVERTSSRRSSSLAQGNQNSSVDCVLVDEMGILLDLYAAADWAFVGGGFGVSMHSAIEPAIFGVPVSCGPSGANKFSEIEELTATGQLSIIRNGDDLDAWLSKSKPQAHERQKWLEQAHKRLGATELIVEIISNP
ncbi:glycosyltransferase N-terminal domain-containing protein [Bdellovibrionota bacterium FG-1]